MAATSALAAFAAAVMSLLWAGPLGAVRLLERPSCKHRSQRLYCFFVDLNVQLTPSLHIVEHRM